MNPSFRPRHLRVTLLLSILFCLPDVQAEGSDRRFQDFVRDTWSLESGLPQRSVMAIAEGAEGYIWVGTQHSLARFDGWRFTEFSTRSEPALPGDDISALFLDSSNRLWIGTQTGVAVRADEQFRSIRPRCDASLTTGDNAIHAIAEDADGEILLGTDEGLAKISDDCVAADDLADTAVGSLLTRDDTLWIGGAGRYWRRAGDTIQSWRLPTGLENVLINDLAWHDGRLWLATSSGLFVHGHEGPVRFGAEAANEPINSLFTDKSDQLWVGTDAALLRLSDGERIERIDSSHPNAHPQIRSFHQDREGNLWMGSAVDGLARYWPGWIDRYGTRLGLGTALTWSVADAGDGTLWVGTNDGLDRLVDGRFESVLSGHDLPHPHAYTLLPEEDHLWVGTRRGLTRLDMSTGEQDRPAALEPLDGFQISGIVPAGQYGRYFFPTSNGLYLWDGEQDLQHLEDELGTRMVRQVRILDDGALLVVTDSGAFLGEPEKLAPLGQEHGLLPDAVYMASHVVDGDLLVIGSMSHGLFVGNGQHFRQMTVADGLPSESSYYINHDDTGHLWVSGYQGLFRLPLEQLRSYASGREVELTAEMLISESGQHRGSQQGFCCNGAGHAKGLVRDDGLWMPTRDGIIRLWPDSVIRSPHPPRVHIDRVRLGDQWHLLKGDGQIEPSIGIRDLAFDFAALSYRDPQSVQVRFRLDGYEQWRNLENIELPRAEYTNLPPGNYRFEVKAANSAGIWNDSPAGVDIYLPARFHETAWFILLLAAGLTLLLAGAYHWQRHQWRTRQRQLEAEVRRQTEALRVTNNQLVDANRELEHLSQIDPLTGLPNRRYLYQQMRKEPSRLLRLRQRLPDDDLVMGFALIDVDHFKQINDEFGHRAGDQILERLGERLQRFLREGDHVARWGGEEFLLVLHALPRQNSEAVLDRLLKQLCSDPYMVDGEREISMTCSIGFAELPLIDDTRVPEPGWEGAVELADRALYHAKHQGRGGWVMIRPGTLDDPARMLRALRDDTQSCIRQGQVVVESRFFPSDS